MLTNGIVQLFVALDVAAVNGEGCIVAGSGQFMLSIGGGFVMVGAASLTSLDDSLMKCSSRFSLLDALMHGSSV